MNDTRNWLIIAHCMNMDGQAASHHVSDKLPYLVKAGITPVLLSAFSGKKDVLYEHHQVFSPAPSGLKFEMRHFLRNRIQSKLLCESLIAIFTIFILPFFLIEKTLLRFDSQWSWCISSWLLGLRLMKKKKFELIYVQGGASSAFLCAHWLSRKYNLPWIAECYDPLIHDSWGRSNAAYNWNRMIEKIICINSSSAIWYTEGALEEASKRNPQLGARGVVVRPGMSPPNFGDACYKKGSKIKFCYFGGLTDERTLSSFLKPLKEFLHENPSMQNKIEIHSYGGDFDKHTLNSIDSSIRSIVYNHGRLRHDPKTNKSGRQRVLEEMKKSDVLLLLHGEGRICKLYIPSKIYEYLWTKRPVFICTPCPGEWMKFINPCSNFVSNQSTKESIQNNIGRACQKWHNGDMNDISKQKCFSAEDSTLVITKLVDSLLG